MLQTESERQTAEDILLLQLEGREAVARLKHGDTRINNQLFPNTRVTRGPAPAPDTVKSPAPAPKLPSAPSSSVISIEVDVAGNLVLHKTGDPPSPAPAPATSKLAHLAKVSRKYHRRSKEEPKKESRLLHYCHICNKGFKDKYSVNVHVRTHTGEKPFSCQLCGKCFRQKAHLAKHQQTHASKQGAGDSQPSSNILQISSNEAESHRF